MEEERMQILKMVEDKKITAKEAAELLEALDTAAGANGTDIQKSKAKWLRVRVLTEEGKVKANVNVPLSLVDVGLKIARKFDPELEKVNLAEIDIDGLFDLIKDGAEGKIVEVHDEESNTNIEIYVE